MVKAKERSSGVEFVLEDEDDIVDDDEEVKVSSPVKKTGVTTGDVQRYEVRIGPPVVSGRKVKPMRTPEDKVEKPRELSGPPAQTPPGMFSQQGVAQSSLSVAGTQQIYKIEDDLRRTRDIVEDLRHNVGMMEGEVKDLRAEMERISYLLRSLEGLKNTMKDMESTVSELSGLYDLISANINPFVEIPPLESRDKVARPVSKPPVEEIEEMDEEGFKDIADMFDDEDEKARCAEDDALGVSLESAEWAVRWAKFLIERVGKEGIEKTLDYYMDLGWIDEGTIDRVLEIARGTVGPKVPADGRKVTWRMDAEDHVKSLEYIRRMRNNRR